MEFRLYWIILGFILLILEMFVGTFDLLAIGIAALVTGGIAALLGIEMNQWQLAGGIFLVATVITIMITRFLVLPKIKGKDAPEPMSGEAMIGTESVIEHINGKDTIRYEGVYRAIDPLEPVIAGDRVRILARQGNHLQVKKV